MCIRDSQRGVAPENATPKATGTRIAALGETPDMPRLPILTSLRGYRPEWLRYDIMSGLSIAAVGLPSAIAYPALAGLPPEVGLYSSILAALGYALLGSSRQRITGPDAGTIMMLGAVFVSLGLTS